jgi:hypothetical protein
MIEKVFTQNNDVCRAIYRVLSEFEKEFAKRKKAYGVCDFNDVERYALALLYDENGDASDIAREWAEKYESIYIDEYQDTNSVQDAIFSAISRKNRFMVGDELEILSPDDNFNKKFIVGEMTDDKGEIITDAKLVQQKIKIKTDLNLSVGDILRKEI